MWYKLIMEVILFGFITVLIGYIAGFLIKKFENSSIPKECADWNKNRVMEKSLFITGILSWFVMHGFEKYIYSFN